MIKYSITRENNPFRAEFPNAIGIIRNLSLQNGKINFELCFYADETARNMATVTPTTPTAAPVPMMGGDSAIITRKNFSEDIAKIEAFADDTLDATPSEKLMECCYSWLATQKIF